MPASVVGEPLGPCRKFSAALATPALSQVRPKPGAVVQIPVVPRSAVPVDQARERLRGLRLEDARHDLPLAAA
jgi:hypothetical protein